MHQPSVIMCSGSRQIILSDEKYDSQNLSQKGKNCQKSSSFHLQNKPAAQNPFLVFTEHPDRFAVIVGAAV